MPTQSKATLKTYFISDATPDEPEFVDLIDSMLNLAEPGTQYMAGTLSASALLADVYNVDAITITDVNNISLTSSNQFGTSSGHIHSFSGSFHQSGSCNSYFLNNLSVGTTSTYQSCEGGLTIFKDKTIGQNVDPIVQAKSSSLLITSSIAQLTFDSNEIHQYRNDLIITSQGDSTTNGNIEFRTGNSTNNITGSDILCLKHDHKVGINTNAPGHTLDIRRSGSDAEVEITRQTGASLLLQSNLNTGSVGTSNNHALQLKTNNTTRLTIDTAGDVGVGTTDPGQKLTVVGNISASGLLFASASNAAGINYHTLLVDTASGQFYHTGSYGGGGGEGTNVVANPGSTTTTLTSITIGSTNYTFGTGFWADHANGVQLATSTDNVGIGSSPSDTHRLSVNGNGVFSGDVIAYYTSDKRLKDNIKPIEDPIGKIKQIGGYSFDWNDKQNTYKGTDFGVIAQEIEQVLPSLVQTREDGFKGVKYDKIVSLLIEAVKDQQKQIDELKKLI